MHFSEQERRELFDTLTSIVSPQFAKLLFVLGVPAGIASPPSAAQGDRVAELLIWAESEGGCGLSEVQRVLREITGQRTLTNASNSPASKPFLEISNDGSMQVWDIIIESWRKLPVNVTFVTSAVSDSASQNPQHARDWKRVMTLTMALYPKYVKLHRYMFLCQELSKLKNSGEAERYRFNAATYFEKLKLESNSFSNDLNNLVMINQVELVSSLCYVPTCSPAIGQSLGASPDSTIFKNGVLLTEKISELLLNGHHIATQLLEQHFINASSRIWMLNLKAVEQTSTASADLLHFSAFLSPNSIPIELIIRGVDELGPNVAASLADVNEDTFVLDALLKPLKDRSLIRRDPDSNSFSIHHLVQEVLRDRMDARSRLLWAERTVRALGRAFPTVEYENWPLCDRLLPHAKIAVGLVKDYQLEFEAAAHLLNQTGRYLRKRGQYAEAESLIAHALELRRRLPEHEHPDVATSLTDLARVYRGQGRNDEAEPLYQQALKLKRDQLGEEHPETATILYNLARLYYSIVWTVFL